MKAKTKSHNEPHTILIVEDSPTQALQVSRILKQKGFRVAVSRNGKEALSYLKEQRPTIIISDIVMPEMDGYELCSTVKKDETLRDIPVILLTSLTSPEDVIKGLQSGADNFITKPYEKEFLLARIQYILANQELRKKGTAEVGLNIYFMGQRHAITSDRMQIMDLLLSTYEHAVLQNQKLNRTKAELETLNKQLEEKVKQRTRRIERLNSVLQAIRGVNQLIVREKNPDRLIQEGCATLISARDYHNAWIALIDESGELVKTAEAGLGKEFLPLLRRLKRGELVNCAQQSLKKSGIIFIKDPSTACTDCPIAKKSHGRGAMAVRLEHSGKIYGLLSISIQKELVRDKEELSLFDEVAGDIAFGLYGIEMDKQRKKSEEELRHERDFMARIMETSPVCIIMINCEGQITFANPGAEDILGFDINEATQRTYNALEWQITDYEGNPFPDDQLPFRRVMDTGQPVFDIRHAIEWPDGRRVLLSINGAPAFDNVGQIDGVICTIQNVTEQIRTTKALQESEKHYRTLFEQSRDASYLTTREGTFFDVNQAFLDLFGYTRGEIKDLKSGETYVNPDERSKFKQEEEKKGFVRDFEVKLRKKDGTEMDCLLTSTIRKADDGSILGYQGLIMDITERKKAEEKIKEYADNLEAMVEERTKELNRALYDTEQSRDRIDGILKSVGDGLIVTDLHNRVILMNRAAEDLLEVRLSEVIDRPIDFAIEDKTLRERIKNTLDKKQEGYEFDFEIPGKNTDHPRTIRGRTSLIRDKAGTHTGIITIMHDVTYEREVDRMKTEFISTAAHELRTPLTSIQGFSELLTTRDDIAEDEKKEYLSLINAQSVNLANIINDLLDISRIESGKGFSLEKALCNIAELIRETVPYFQVQSKKHRFDLVRLDKPLGAMVDKDKIRQVLENILSNADKYSPEGGTIRIIGEVVDDHYQVSIEDQGIGMTPVQVEKIFDKFYRADASNTAIPGTGLGMSIVKYLVEAHGGEVWVESEAGKGTTVKFILPLESNKLNKKEVTRDEKGSYSRRPDRGEETGGDDP